METVKLSAEFVKQIVEVVKRVLRQEYGQQYHTPRHGSPQVRRRQGILNTALSAASNAATSPASVVARDITRNPSTGDLELTGNETTITHRFEHIAADANTLCAYEYLDGEWQLYKIDCAAMGSPLS